MRQPLGAARGAAGATYRLRFTRAPHLVLVHSADQTQVGDMVIRTEQAVQPNNFWLGI